MASRRRTQIRQIGAAEVLISIWPAPAQAARRAFSQDSQPPSLTVTDLSGRARDAVERLVERAQAAFLCIACVPGRFLRRSCRQSVRCAPAVHSESKVSCPAGALQYIVAGD